jgi:hypothetical protein
VWRVAGGKSLRTPSVRYLRDWEFAAIGRGLGPPFPERLVGGSIVKF